MTRANMPNAQRFTAAALLMLLPACLPTRSFDNVFEHCADGLRGGNETDVDCGGPQCGPCALGRACVADRDCAPAGNDRVGCEAGRCVVNGCAQGAHLCNGACVS